MKKATGYGLQATAVVAMLIASLTANAQDKSCVSLKTEAQLEQDYVDAQGKPAGLVHIHDLLRIGVG